MIDNYSMAVLNKCLKIFKEKVSFIPSEKQEYDELYTYLKANSGDAESQET